MQRVRERKVTSLKLPVLFILLSGIPLTLLGWFAWRLLDQERALETQRLKERLDNAASLIAQELDREIVAKEDLLLKIADDSIPVPSDSAFVVLNAEGVTQHRGIPLAYYPQIVSTPSSETVSSAEIDEFRDGNCSRASEAYRKLASSTDHATRARGLVRLARCLRKLERTSEALAVYGELAGLTDARVAGDPAELVAHRERIALFKRIRDGRSEHETTLLREALSSGRFAIDRSTYSFYAEEVAEPLQSYPGMRLAQAMDEVWPLLEQQPAGRHAWNGTGASTVTVWRTVPGGTAALLTDVNSLFQTVGRLAGRLQVGLALDDSRHRDRIETIKSSRETGLPWTIHVSPIDATTVQSSWASRRNLLLAGFALMASVIAAASYAVFRAVNREISVARLQSDFVAAVSHEFRTPLTAMRHLTEMLEEGYVASDRAAQYYQALGRETRRLHEMVENLLDFGRLESGRRTYHMESTSPIELAKRVVNEFHDRGTNRLELANETTARLDWRIDADQQALSLALRNLVDNAIKYSPENTIVQVAIESRDGFAGISVQDHGGGISPDEQRTVFGKFVRGAAARELNVKGTGIGLAMVDQIVRAHGGHLELASEPGQGARFTILLPLLDQKS
jgi:signal transduction histidine kinase